MNKLNSKKSIVPEKLGKSLLQNFIKSLINQGQIDPRGKTRDEIFKEFRKIALEWVGSKEPFFITIDHTNTILKQARIFQQKKEYSFSCIFYAIWCEHWINSVISDQCHKKGITEDNITTIIRRLSIEDKFSWGLELLSLKPIMKHHLAQLRKLFDCRNQFVHYKYKSYDADSDDKKNEDGKYENISRGFDKTLSYLRNYKKRNILFNVQVSKIL